MRDPELIHRKVMDLEERIGGIEDDIDHLERNWFQQKKLDVEKELQIKIRNNSRPEDIQAMREHLDFLEEEQQTNSPLLIGRRDGDLL